MEYKKGGKQTKCYRISSARQAPPPPVTQPVTEKGPHCPPAPPPPQKPNPRPRLAQIRDTRMRLQDRPVYVGLFRARAPVWRGSTTEGSQRALLSLSLLALSLLALSLSSL